MPVKYSNYLEINPSFESVVDIDADQRNHNLWREYIVGKDMEDLMEYLCQSLGNEAPDARRSFWVNGTYGTGKSYAGIFVKHLMEEKTEVVEDFLSKNNRLSKYKNRFMKCRRGGDYLVVWKTGCTGIRSGDMMLIEAEKAIHDALISKFGERADLGSRSLLNAIKEKLNDPSINWDYMISTTSLSDDYSSVEKLRSEVEAGSLAAIQAAATALRQKKMGLVNNLETFQSWISEIISGNNLDNSGIFFIWDEFTEYVSYSDDHTVMQQISEFCKVKPFFTFFVVHKSTDLVKRVGGEEQYQLITHRFHEVEFHLTADASLDLIAGSIQTHVGMEEHWKEARKQVVKNIRPALADMTVGLDDKMAEMINDLCPMHPMTIRLLARVAENYAAAERTMFRFMKDRSNEDIGFVGYIHRYGPDDQACWLTPEWLWDYFFTRESDFHDKDTKVAEYIRHYEDNRHLVEANENAHRIFKIAMLLMAVMSSAKGIYSGNRTHGGIAATVDCLVLCLAGVMSREQVLDLLSTLEESKVIVLDTAVNGTVRLQLPFRNDGGSFQVRYEANDKKYTRYQMFSKDGVFSQEFEKIAWDPNDALVKRMKICVCCAETISIKNRLEEVTKDLEKHPYKLGVLFVTVRDELQYVSIQGDLQQRAIDSNNPRLIIALVKNPLNDDTRKKWLTAITKQEMASESAQTGAAGQAGLEASTIVQTWVQSTVNGSKMIAWNGTKVFTNQYGKANLQNTIRMSVFEALFPYAPETIVVTNTAYKTCNDSAPLAGIQRTTNNQQLKSVLTGLGSLLNITSIEGMIQATGNKAAESISQLAKVVRDEMQSGQKVVLSDLWSKLMQPPFGYYDTIACGILLGFVFTGYKDSEFSWTDNSQGTHVLGETTLKTMVLNMVKGKMTTDYLSSGSQTFQLFRKYIKAIMNLSDVQIANETECWHNMREAVTKTGAPFWTLKYLPDSDYNGVESKATAIEIIEQIQLFIAQDKDHELIMGNVNQLFSGRGKLRVPMANAFQNKHTLSSAFQTFLFSSSDDLKTIAAALSIQPEELSDKLHMVMQDAIYTWTEEQVREKLPDIVSEYQFLDATNSVMGKVYHSLESASSDLRNLFLMVHIPLDTLSTLNKPWLTALQALYKVAYGKSIHMTSQERATYATELSSFGKAAMDFLRDGKPLLAEILENENLECTSQEIDSVYSGLKDITIDTSRTVFEKELKSQISRISQARNRILLQEIWRSRSSCDSVKDWCIQHGAPLLWIVSKEERRAITTVINVMKNQRVLDQDVVNAITTLKSIDAALLTDDKVIADALVLVVGLEYRSIFETERNQILTAAKMQLGNDMSGWDIGELTAFQQLLKKAQQEKAKREKLSTTKNIVKTMNEGTLRTIVQAFLDAHPEYCDDFNG